MNKIYYTSLWIITQRVHGSIVVRDLWDDGANNARWIDPDELDLYKLKISEYLEVDFEWSIHGGNNICRDIATYVTLEEDNYTFLLLKYPHFSHRFHLNEFLSNLT